MSTTKHVKRAEDIGQAAVNPMLDIHSGLNLESLVPSHIASCGWNAYFQTGRRACQDVEPNTKGPSKERNLPQVSIFEPLDNRLPFDRIVNSSISESEISQTCFGLWNIMPLGQGSILQCYIFFRLIRT